MPAVLSPRSHPLPTMALVASLLLGACTAAPSEPSAGPSDLASTTGGNGGAGGGTTTEPTQAPPPKLGGPKVRRAVPPKQPMDALERPVARRLAREIRDDGLSLDYLSCPPWDGEVPTKLTCSAYLDGVKGTVLVKLVAADRGQVSFDAHLAHGVVATASLVRTLEAHGYGGVDCGSRPAYPARVGSTIVCAVTGPDGDGHVVATVTRRNGAVTVRDL